MHDTGFSYCEQKTAEETNLTASVERSNIIMMSQISDTPRLTFAGDKSNMTQRAWHQPGISQSHFGTQGKLTSRSRHNNLTSLGGGKQTNTPLSNYLADITNMDSPKKTLNISSISEVVAYKANRPSKYSQFTNPVSGTHFIRERMAHKACPRLQKLAHNAE